MPEWLGYEGQRVVVAGGAGTLGAALVEGFIASGASVGIVDLSVEHAAARAASAVAADLTHAPAAREAIERTRAELGGLDVFVHCVGINDRRPLEEYAPADWQRIVDVNLSSAFHTATVAATAMREAHYGRILFFSSVAGRSGHKLHGPYAATKAAINQLMRVLAHEFAEFGVTANAVAPGYMDTELTRRYLEENPARRAALVELIPAGRFGALQEVVDPVLFLCSPRASFITGQVVYIDGGRTIL